MPRNHNHSPNTDRHPWGLAIAGGVAILAAGGVLASCMFGGGDKKVSNDAVPTRGGTIPATASQYPSLSATPLETMAPSLSPSPAETTASASPTRPEDPYVALRRTIAARYTGCALDFTNGGTSGKRTTLEMDIAGVPNPDSVAARSQEQSNVTWGATTIVALGIDRDGKLTGKRIESAPVRDINMVKGPLDVPAPGNGASYLIAIKTDATSPYDGGHNKTTYDTVCGEITNDTGTHWRPTDFPEGVDTPVTREEFLPN